MKIVCENCGAKYSIADEKVKGKAFKIRCKKCGDSIVVRGDVGPQADEEESPVWPMPSGQPPQASEEVETKVFDYSNYQPGGEEEPAVWHIVVEGQQQGPYTGLSEILEYLGAGSLDSESYVWKEGFGDWKPIRDVAELYHASPGAAAAPVSTPDRFGAKATPGLVGRN